MNDDSQGGSGILLKSLMNAIVHCLPGSRLYFHLITS